MSRGQEQASKRNSAPRGSRDRDWDLWDFGTGQTDCRGPAWPWNTCKQLNSSELEGDWRLS